MENSKYNERYSRQILFSPIGNQGQYKLSESKVAIIGCGGLVLLNINTMTYN